MENKAQRKPIHDPRSESFIDMLHYSICPLLHKYSFTFWIVSFDIIYYALQLIFQQAINWSPRPQQKVLFYFGQLYPTYAYWEAWRLLLSLEQHRNEIHLLLSVAMKLHFYSFVEHIIGRRNICIMYGISGISATLFQCLLSSQAGVCGSFQIGIVGIALHLQGQMLSKSSPQEQLQFYFDYQATQDVGLMMAKILISFGVFFLISLKDSGVLFAGTSMFLVQSMLLGNYFQITEAPNHGKQRSFSHYLVLGLVFLILLTEIIMFWKYTSQK